MRRSIPILVLFTISAFAGCGGGGDEHETAKITGTVTYDGKTVTGGLIYFEPKSSGDAAPGKMGTARIREDGTFAVSTYGTDDGAVIGTHKLSYEPPPPRQMQDPNAGHDAKSVPSVPSEFVGLVPETPEVVVAPGESTIEVKLIKR